MQSDSYSLQAGYTIGQREGDEHLQRQLEPKQSSLTNYFTNGVDIATSWESTGPTARR